MLLSLIFQLLLSCLVGSFWFGEVVLGLLVASLYFLFITRVFRGLCFLALISQVTCLHARVSSVPSFVVLVAC